MKKHILIYSLSVILILTTVGCKKDSDENPTQSKKMLGWTVGGSSRPNHEYGAIFHTTDGGKTWIMQGDSIQFSGSMFNDICIIDKNTLIVVGGPLTTGIPNVFKSIDGGTSWANVGTNLKNSTYGGIFNLNKDRIWIVGDSGTIYYSDDIANSWIKVDVPLEYQNDIFLRVAGKSIDNIWVVGDKHANDDYPVMLHTTDAGASWQRQNPIKDLNVNTGGTPGHILGIKTFGNTVWAIGGFGEFVIRSDDNGLTWSDITSQSGPTDANDIVVLSETEAYVAYDYGGFYSTSNAGQDWTEYYPPSSNWLVGLAILNDVNIWVCGDPSVANDYGAILYSHDAGTTWEEQTPQFIKDFPQVAMYKIRFIETN